MQTLVDDTPLHRRIVVVIHRHVLLAAPSETAVVDDDVTGVLYADGTTLDEAALLVGRIRLAVLSWQFQHAQTRTDVADDDILRTTQIQLAAPQQDTLAGRRLTCYGDILQLGTYGTFVLTLGIGTDLYRATHAKHNGGILTSGVRQCPAQRALATVCQCRHLHHLTTAAARGIFAEALSRRKRQRLPLQGHHHRHHHYRHHDSFHITLTLLCYASAKTLPSARVTWSLVYSEWKSFCRRSR